MLSKCLLNLMEQKLVLCTKETELERCLATVMFALIMWLPWARLYQSTAGPSNEDLLLAQPCLILLGTPPQTGGSCRSAGWASPSPSGLQAFMSWGSILGGDFLARSDDWQPQNTRETTQRGFELQGKKQNKTPIIIIIITLSRGRLSHVVTCIMRQICGKKPGKPSWKLLCRSSQGQIRTSC